MMKFTCGACSFASRELFLGPAPYPEKYDPVLVTCDRCKTLRAVHRPDSERGCRKHRRPFTVLHEEKDVPCPRCGRMLLQDCIGTWD